MLPLKGQDRQLHCEKAKRQHGRVGRGVNDCYIHSINGLDFPFISRNPKGGPDPMAIAEQLLLLCNVDEGIGACADSATDRLSWVMNGIFGYAF